MVYLGDDLIGLAVSGAVRPVPSAVSVKPGGEAGFGAATGRGMAPDARVEVGPASRLVDPGWLGAAADEAAGVAMVAFPQFRAGAALAVETLDPTAALARAIAGGLSVGEGLADAGCTMLARLFASVPCLHLTYGADSGAADAADDLMARMSSLTGAMVDR
jgi:hypothetical protein